MRRYVRETHRAEVLDAVCRASTLLIGRARPKIITMSTFDAGLPERALDKYRRLASAVQSEGYTCRRSVVDEDGRLQWLFERAD